MSKEYRFFKGNWEHSESDYWMTVSLSKVPPMFKINHWGYFDSRPELITTLGVLAGLLLAPISLWFLLLCLVPYGFVCIHIPYDTGQDDKCDSLSTGIAVSYEYDYVRLSSGKKYKYIYFPHALEYHRISYLLKDQTWLHRAKNSKVDTFSEVFKQGLHTEIHQVTDSYDGTLVTATCTVEEREWRRYWWPFNSWFAFIKRTVDIEFDQEVGPRKGEWKGGTIGMSVLILPGESIKDALDKRLKI